MCTWECRCVTLSMTLGFFRLQCREAFEADDIRQMEKAIDPPQTDSDENNVDDHRFIAVAVALEG